MSLNQFEKTIAPFLPMLLLVWMCLALWLTLFPSELISSAAKLGNPKLGHVILFGGWTFLLGITLMLTFDMTKISILLIIVAGVVFGAFVELLQYLMPFNRSGNITDILFNTVGCLLAGSLLAFYRNVSLSKRVAAS
ncbi:MAG: VanZ family protein [Balneolales bacterium]|nr:VanZ family protein [Balneolales bacterium]